MKRQTPLSEWKSMTACLPPARNFRSAIGGKDCRIIAEVKRRSPSRGLLCREFDPAGIARVYQENGAAAVSVLTDREFFAGDKEHLIDIRAKVKLPLLRKDFIVDPCQIYETRLLGADAVLLIAAILETGQLGDYLAVTQDLGMSALVEVHDRQDLDKALAAGAGIIGINNRNLKTFVTDLQTSRDLIDAIPDDCIVVSESGIRTRADIETLTAAGIHAFLIGETLMQAADRGGKLRELLGE
ncbi:MAG: indole-3-glycerol phosphate synthase TrpC [Syntrophus sp. (in: bacteria)]|nr:indole-3-glycerol phosphate synthase TrpC [Syntrophus sp. (in: bacteria)]